MEEYTTSEVGSIVKDAATDSLENLLRRGARRMLQAALEHEVSEYINRYRNISDEQGHRQVVRNGYHKQREVTTGIGKIPIKQPRVNDRREGERFTSAILPKYARRSPSIDTLIPTLYLEGVSSSPFPEALEAIPGKGAPGLSPTNVTRLKQIWEDEYKSWKQRDLTGKHYVYVWADGIYFNVRLDKDRPCVLVLVGATAEGCKEVIATSAWAIYFAQGCSSNFDRIPSPPPPECSNIAVWPEAVNQGGFRSERSEAVATRWMTARFETLGFAPAFSGSPKTPEIAPTSPSRRPEASDKKSTDSRTLQASMFHNFLKYKRFLSLA